MPILLVSIGLLSFQLKKNAINNKDIVYAMESTNEGYSVSKINLKTLSIEKKIPFHEPFTDISLDLEGGMYGSQIRVDYISQDELYHLEGESSTIKRVARLKNKETSRVLVYNDELFVLIDPGSNGPTKLEILDRKTYKTKQVINLGNNTFLEGKAMLFLKKDDVKTLGLSENPHDSLLYSINFMPIKAKMSDKLYLLDLVTKEKKLIKTNWVAPHFSTTGMAIDVDKKEIYLTSQASTKSRIVGHGDAEKSKTVFILSVPDFKIKRKILLEKNPDTMLYVKEDQKIYVRAYLVCFIIDLKNNSIKKLPLHIRRMSKVAPSRIMMSTEKYTFEKNPKYVIPRVIDSEGSLIIMDTKNDQILKSFSGFYRTVSDSFNYLD